MKRRIYPKHVSEFRDRHGKLRTRYRVTGQPTRYFQSSPGSAEWLAELAAFRVAAPRLVNAEQIDPGTINDLVARYLESTSFKTGAPATQTKNRGILDAFRTVHGERLVRDASFEKMDKLIAAKAATHPAAARNMRKQLRRLFEFAVRIKMRSDNPVEGIRLAPTKPRPDGERGHHTWTEDEIAQFQAFYPPNTRARLAQDLMLWTGVRKSDVVRLGRQHIRGGRISIGATKGGKIVTVPVAPQLKTVIAAHPSTNMTFLVTAYGKPFTANGFGNWFRKQCNAAGLPQCSAHGLRKAIARRMAENDEGNAGIKSVTQHSTDGEVTRYTKGVEQSRLADKVMARLSAAHLATRGLGDLANQSEIRRKGNEND